MTCEDLKSMSGHHDYACPIKVGMTKWTFDVTAPSLPLGVKLGGSVSQTVFCGCFYVFSSLVVVVAFIAVIVDVVIIVVAAFVVAVMF